MADVIEADFRKATPRKSRAARRREESRAAGELTQDLVNTIAAPAKGKLRIADHQVKGLFLRVTAAGAKSYVVRYSADGRRGESALGDARAITLKSARAKALDTLSDLTVRRIDPVQAKRSAIRNEKAKKEESFAALAVRYRADAARRKRESTLTFEGLLLDNHILPKLGARPYAELRRGEIISFIESIGARVDIGADLRFFASGSVRYESERRTSTQSHVVPSSGTTVRQILSQADIQDENAKVNLRFGIGGADERWAIELWGTNIFDEQTRNVTFNIPLRGVAQYQARGAFLEEPAIYGITLRANY